MIKSFKNFKAVKVPVILAFFARNNHDTRPVPAPASGEAKAAINPLPFSQTETRLLNELNQSFTVERDALANRYTLKDFIFSPEISGIFQEHLNKEFSSESMIFLQELKAAVNPPDPDKIKGLNERFIKIGAQFQININPADRAAAKEIFSCPEADLERILRLLQRVFTETMGILQQAFGRFITTGGITKAVVADAITANNLMSYINLVILANQQLINDLPESESIIPKAIIRQAHQARFITLRPELDRVLSNALSGMQNS